MKILMIMNTLNQIVRYVNLADHNPRKFTKVDKDFTKKHDFNDIKFPVKIRDIHKMEKRNSNGISPFAHGNKKTKTSNLCFKKYTVMCYDTLHRGRKHFFHIVNKLLVKKKY